MDVKHIGMASSGNKGKLSDYIAIARLDHSTKHIFIVPGAILAYLLRGVHSKNIVLTIFAGLFCAVCIASANYVINEFLDRKFDRHHPVKSQRRAVQLELNGTYVAAEWFLLAAAGLLTAGLTGKTMFVAAVLFVLQGVVYNVEPIRSKNRPILDVISESINNPLRLMIGWAMIDPTTIPPGSIILSYWLGGAFLMAAKRLSEYREITASHGKDVLARYRASFAGYTDISLTVSCLLYSLLSSFFLAIFLIKYRIEYIITLPGIAALFAYYLAISMKPGSSAQSPEKLFRERGLFLLVAVISGLFITATLVNMPFLGALTSQRYITFQ